MSKDFTLIIVVAGFFIMTLISCESHEQKADDAFEHYKEEKLLTKGSAAPAVAPAIISEPAKPELIRKCEAPDEWIKFNAEIEREIISNEIKIKKIKGIPNGNTDMFRKVTRIERDNNDLRREMSEYRAAMKERMENFKAMMNHDVDQINTALKDLAVNTKK